MTHEFNTDFFNKLYKEKSKSFFWGLKPEKSVEFLLQFKKSPGKVLDLGVGDGRNSIFLAQQGFSVTGVDFSEEAIRKMRDLSIKEKLRIKLFVCNIGEFKFKEDYDIILSLSTLHFLRKREIKKMIQRIKRHTVISGLNLISVFTRDNPHKNFPYLFKENQLKNFYKDWQIINYKEFFTKIQKHGGGISHRHAVASLLAKRIKI